MPRASTFERLVRALEHPTVVVTAAARLEMAGCLVGFSSQCSIDPPRYCVFLSKHDRAYGVARRASHLLVHFLGRRQHALAEHFGERTSDVTDTFDKVRWKPGPDGRTPLLTDVDTWLFGKVTSRHDAGDHVAFVLDPQRARLARRFRQLDFAQVRDLEAAR
jgi:flavin reductase (DIM6/NTAB) family NADH-FMN oxidoreductase RutF